MLKRLLKCPVPPTLSPYSHETKESARERQEAHETMRGTIAGFPKLGVRFWESQ